MCDTYNKKENFQNKVWIIQTFPPLNYTITIDIHLRMYYFTSNVIQYVFLFIYLFL